MEGDRRDAVLVGGQEKALWEACIWVQALHDNVNKPRVSYRYPLMFAIIGLTKMCHFEKGTESGKFLDGL